MSTREGDVHAKFRRDSDVAAARVVVSEGFLRAGWQGGLKRGKRMERRTYIPKRSSTQDLGFGYSSETGQRNEWVGCGLAVERATSTDDVSSVDCCRGRRSHRASGVFDLYEAAAFQACRGTADWHQKNGFR